ncbi:MAG: hypothetical protein R6U17_07120 [Thermoplasmata archaeon]
MNERKTLCLFVTTLLIISLIFGGSVSEGGHCSPGTTTQRSISPTEKSQWEAGNHWNYSFESEGYNAQLDKINQDGWLNLSVKGEEYIKINDEWVNVYNVSFDSEGDMTGYTVRWGREFEYDFYGITRGSLYYHTDTLEMASGDYNHHIFGTASVPLFKDLIVDTSIDVTFHNTQVTNDDYSDFYSFPISDSDNWQAVSVLDMYSYTFTEYDGPVFAPDFDIIEEEYMLEHTYALEAKAIDEDLTEVTGGIEWSREGTIIENGEEGTISDSGSGNIQHDFNRAVGNADFIFIEGTFHKTLNYNVDEITYTLDSHNYDPPADYGLEVSVENPTSQSRAGESAEYQFTLSSTGYKSDTILWDLSDDHGLDSVDGPESVTLPWGESETALLTLTFSADAEPGIAYEHEIRFYSENDPSIQETVTVTTHLLDERGFEVNVAEEQKQTNPGYSVGYEFGITNTGTDQDTILWQLLDEEHLEDVEGPASITLGSEESTTVWIHLTFSSDAETDIIYEHSIEFYLESDNTIRKTVNVRTEVLDRYGLEAYTVDEHRQIRRGMSANYRFTVTATGTHVDVIYWELLDFEDVDEVQGPDSINLESKESKTVWINLTYSQDANQGEIYTKQIRFYSENDDSVQETVTIYTEILEESQPMITGKHPDEDVLELWPDEIIQFYLEVDNPGDHVITINWYIDDVKTLEDETLTIAYTDLDIGQYRIKGEMSYDGGSPAVYWDVYVMEEEDDEINITAFIEGKNPDVDEMTLYPSQTMDFSVIVGNPDGDDVYMKWTMNGDEISQGLEVSLGYDDIVGQSCAVVASLMFDDRVVDSVNWTLNKIDKSSPSISDKRPRINSIPGHSSDSDITFSVEIDNPESVDISLRWYVNGELHREDSENFTINAKDLSHGNYTIKVELLDENLDVLESNTWTLEVLEPEGSSFMLYIILALVGACCGVIALVLFRRKRKKDVVEEDKAEEKVE